MKKIYLSIWLIAAALTVGCLQSCMFNCVHGSGREIVENRSVGEFKRISISGGFKIVLKQDNSMGLKITADDNLLKYIKTVNDGDRLHIYTKRNICDAGEMTINIGVRELDEVRASGAVEVVSDGQINTQDLRFKLSGATKINMELNAANVYTSGSGDTEVTLKGHADSHQIDLSGAGSVHALDFVVGNCEIATSGVGHSDVNVLHTLHISSSGASEVRYRGDPSITNDKSGASSVEKVD